MEGLSEQTVGAGKGPVSVDGQSGLKEQTFISPPMTLENGQISNKYLAIDWPEGHILVKSFTADVVHAQVDGSPPPVTPCCGGGFEASRDTSFLHHWTVNKWQASRQFFETLVKSGGREFNERAKTDKWGLPYAFLNEAGRNEGADGPCWDGELHVFFGIGNEVRGKPLNGKHEAFEFPDPYGIEFNMEDMRKKGEFMILNTHLIDIRNVTDRRKCAECECAYLGVVSDQSTLTEGGLSCCHSTSFDGGKCPVVESVPKTNETYFVRYTVKWHDFDVATAKPLEVITFDATDNNTKWGDFPFIPGGFKEQHVALNNDRLSVATVNDPRSGVYVGRRACHIEYFVPACTEVGNACSHTIKNSWEMPYPVEFVYARNHFHIGGVSAMLSSDKGPICSSTATYDDAGFLVDISACGAWNGTLGTVAAGERVYSEVTYKQDELPHYGAMAMSFTYVHVPRGSKPAFLV